MYFIHNTAGYSNVYGVRYSSNRYGSILTIYFMKHAWSWYTDSGEDE